MLSSFACMLHLERIGPEGDLILRNLYEHYVHDMSEWLPLDVGANGAFAHDTAPLWQGDFAVFLARVEGALAGFAVVAPASPWLEQPKARDLKDFFVLRRYRHQGVGDALARHLWDTFRAPWQVRVLVHNRPALPFWRRLVRGYAGDQHEELPVRDRDRDWVYLRFDSARCQPAG